MVRDTPRRIITNKGLTFELEIFYNFWKLFRISKIRTYNCYYYFKLNGICKRYTQTFKYLERIILGLNKQAKWDKYFIFACLVLKP